MLGVLGVTPAELHFYMYAFMQARPRFSVFYVPFVRLVRNRAKLVHELNKVAQQIMILIGDSVGVEVHHFASSPGAPDIVIGFETLGWTKFR